MHEPEFQEQPPYRQRASQATVIQYSVNKIDIGSCKGQIKGILPCQTPRGPTTVNTWRPGPNDPTLIISMLKKLVTSG